MSSSAGLLGGSGLVAKDKAAGFPGLAARQCVELLPLLPEWQPYPQRRPACTYRLSGAYSDVHMIAYVLTMA